MIMNKNIFNGHIIIEEDIMNILQKICLIFTLIGAVNWGLVGIFEFNLVAAIFGDGVAARVVYAIVGICAVINIMLLFMDFDHSEHHEHHHHHDRNLRVD